ncbi:septum site-determining protein MinC [Wielerella bovis]|uniref:septum site-determining protein MinC n=1 Tax=Wielerella bovis TaxID=2917790 RepID=UPI0020199FD3|nr:septum site-determining protein MinC [Wielerella bovis]ULJ64407.1 septum site-determining protein MinC [Wielerella bovis]ULJ66686.1 septum site-determining protein MinC [Wielerella bovis]
MKPAFDLKSARLRVEALTVRLSTTDSEAIAALLAEKQEQYQIFTSMPFILDASHLSSSNHLDLEKIVAIFAAQQLRVVALRHNEHDWSDKAKQAGLMWLSSEKHEHTISSEHHDEAADLAEHDAAVALSQQNDVTQPENASCEENTDIQAASSDNENNESEEQPENIKSEENTDIQTTSSDNENNESEEQPENAETETEPELELTARPTMVINYPVRTGQQIYAQKSDLLVLGIVSEGAELIADGNIYVYAPMRGRALAGESGDKNARIFIQSMQAELVSIAGIYRVFEQNLPPHLHKHAVRIELQEDDRLAISAINTQ